MENKPIRIAIAGNPNSGKTTLFNALTGSNQFVGNWPGVTVEKKEGKLKKRDDVIVTDLPGVYSLSPYTLEEVVARDYLLEERPDAILNIVDGTNIERNLYLTTQLFELGIPVVIAINMMDVVRKNGDDINIEKLSAALGCRVVEISALKEWGITEATEAAISAVGTKPLTPKHNFAGEVEHVIAHIEEAAVHNMPEEKQRWYAIKIFERDEKVMRELSLPEEVKAHIEQDIRNTEAIMDDDSESIIANERYNCVEAIVKRCCKKKHAGKLTLSDKIDNVVTNRFAALPIFGLVMFLVYFISVSTVGTFVTDWANDGLFGDGWRFLGIGTSDYEAAMDSFANDTIFTEEVKATVQNAVNAGVMGADKLLTAIESGSFADFEETYGFYGDSIAEAGFDISAAVDAAMSLEALPDPTTFGMWIDGIPVVIGNALDAVNCADWLQSLILDGIVGGVGAVLGFVPQMVVLFAFLSFLEACGYMSRIAFVLDKIFRKFGLSGKSFIPMLVGTGCGVPGIMASRTIENERDRRMTIITTTFVPCGAKLPVIALIASALFSDAWWVAPSAYFIGIAAVIISGIILKKTKLFAGEPAPFVMELPAYHMPTAKNLLRNIWDRSWSFIKKAGTVILVSSMIIWLFSRLGFTESGFGFSVDMNLADSIIGKIGGAICFIFAPVGFGTIEATVATFMGLIAKEEIVSVLGVLDFAGMTQLAGYSFLIFNLLCAPCFAAMGAIRREMNSPKWTAFAITYQCVFAYVISLIVYQLGAIFTAADKENPVGIIFALIALAFLVFMIVKPFKEATKLTLNNNKNK